MQRDWFNLFFSFDGRISRSEYWLGVGALLSCAFLTGLFAVAIGAMKNALPQPLHLILAMLVGLLAVCVMITFMFGHLALVVKRLHDHNMSGWWILAQVIPYIGPFCLFVILGCLRGTQGPNQYGEDPIEAGSLQYA